jgi:16S rRNA (guanine527-N7)-methyltransferase
MNDETIFEPDSESLDGLLASLGITVDAGQLELLDHYRRLLWMWNERMNLTRHTTMDKFARRDVVDSWQLCQLVKVGERVLDIGTGGGVPGLVMAILRPDLQLVVSESTQKKGVAVTSIVEQLKLPVVVHACRAEEVLELVTFDTLVARAVAPLAKIVRWLEPHWSAFDRLLLIKGPNWVAERAEARQAGLLRRLELRKAASYLTPHTCAENVILKISASWRGDQD